MKQDNNLNPDSELLTLEAHLAGTLKRVTPTTDMVQRLRGRIQLPSRSEIKLRLSDWRTLFLVFGGVMSGMMLIVTLARAFYYLVGRRSAI